MYELCPIPRTSVTENLLNITAKYAVWSFATWCTSIDSPRSILCTLTPKQSDNPYKTELYTAGAKKNPFTCSEYLDNLYCILYTVLYRLYSIR